MEKEFCLEEYLHRAAVPAVSAEKDNMAVFEQICRIVEAEFDKEWQETDDEAKNRKLNSEKKAIMGFEEETAFYKEKIREILREKNPAVRVAISAIAAETPASAVTLLSGEGWEGLEVSQISAARSRKAGPYHLMTGQNPIWLLAARGKA